MKKLSALFLLLFCFSLSQAYAQFEGKVVFNNYDIESGSRVKGDDSFTMYITPDRMLLQGENSYNVRGNFTTEGLLIRHKERDFVFLNGEKTAMKITKEGITSFMNLFGDDADEEVEETESDFSYTQTGESKNINGFTAEKFVFTEDDSNDRVEVWMTRDLDINWGILAEPWGDNMQFLTDSELPFNLIFKEGYFPVKWDQYEDGELTESMEAEVTSTDIAREAVEISPDIKVVSLSDYLFEQMRKNAQQNEGDSK